MASAGKCSKFSEGGGYMFIESLICVSTRDLDGTSSKVILYLLFETFFQSSALKSSI